MLISITTPINDDHIIIYVQRGRNSDLSLYNVQIH